MKPPHGNRPGGSGRPPSDRGPKPGGSGRPFADRGARPANVSPNRLSLGSGPGEQRSSEQRSSEQRSSEQRPPRPENPRPQGGGQPFHQRPDGPPREGQRRDGQRYDQRPRHQDGPRPGPDTPKGAVWLYGHHAVAAALANKQRRLRRLMLTEEAEAALTQMFAQPWPLAPERTDRARIDQLLGRDIAHQGAALLADPLAQPSLASVLERSGPIVVLDQVTDPRNIGAIMRSAAAFGVAAVITQDRNAPEETGSLAKAASGALETMPLLRAVNIARTLIALKAAGVWCVGLDASGKPLSGPFFAGRRVALVLGAEGEGMRRLTRDTCDEIAGLSIKGVVESLNVSAAAAVALYELTRQS
jgi:23S rRNA (guanosine2251-2'-O)-methyltransferase